MAIPAFLIGQLTSKAFSVIKNEVKKSKGHAVQSMFNYYLNQTKLANVAFSSWQKLRFCLAELIGWRVRVKTYD